ncbi:MAG: hypothetical protein V3V06_08340 [Dehalococcoidia bacterium]
MATRLAVKGSVFQQTRTGIAQGFETVLEVESPNDPELVAAAIRNASNGCFTEQTIRNPVDFQQSIIVNGEPFRLDDYPPKPVQRYRGAAGGS